MEVSTVVNLLRDTTSPTQWERAEGNLKQMNSTPGFPPLLLQIIVTNEIEMPIRQAAAIYLKNLIVRFWNDSEDRLRFQKSDSPIFVIHEQDRLLIRNSIIEATFQAPHLTSYHLATCINCIVRNDFPDRWPQIVDKISLYLQSPNSANWSGALLALYQLVKIYEYSSRAPLLDAMKILLPLMYRLMINILYDMSDESIIMQKQILKIYFTLVQFALPLELIVKEMFSQWMEVLRIEADKPAPEYPPLMDDEEKTCMPLWKLKKWTIRILHRLFQKFGSPGHVNHVYIEFADWYLATFSGGILEVMLRILDQYRAKVFVSPNVLHHTINYVTRGICFSHSWKFLKPHMFAIIRDIVFPIMCHNDVTEELFVNDPKTYLRSRTDIIDDCLTPLPATTALLIHCCKKRKNMLLQTMQFCHFVISNEGNNYTVQQKDGALHMVGSLARVLLKRNIYKDRIEDMLMQYVLPEVQSSHDHMRARAFWVLHEFAGAKIKNEQLLGQMINLMIDSLLADTSLPVKFEAAIGIQSFLVEEPLVEKYVVTKINEITLEILNLLRLSENEILTSVVQKLLCSFSQQLMPVAREITNHLASTFIQVFGECQMSDEKAITSMALLNTIDTVMTLMMENDKITHSLQPEVLSVVVHIFHYGLIDFYEEAFSLIYNLTTKSISPELWQVFGKIYEIFQNKGQEYFTEMMPALHNYITVDTTAFLSNDNHVVAIFNMCTAILNGNFEEDPECHAAKLLEIIILQCRGRITQAVPCFVSLALSRLTRDIKTSELRVMCLQVVIAALFYDPNLLLEILRCLRLEVPSGSLATHFIQQWITDSDCFLGIHDRKLSIIGFCVLLGLEPQSRDQILTDSVPKIMPACMLLFDGLKKTRTSRDALEEEIESEDENENNKSDDYEVLSSDADEIENSTNTVSANFTDADSDYNDDYSATDVTPFETYSTPLDKADCPIDEYVIFHDTINKLRTNEKQFYDNLMIKLSDDDAKIMIDVMKTAELKRTQNAGQYCSYANFA